MVATRKLAELAERKTLLQARIAVRRLECVVAVAHLARPLSFVDRVHGFWRQLSPLFKIVGLPLSYFALKKLFQPSAAGSGGVRRWLATAIGALPIILQVAQAVRAMRTKPAPSGGADTPASAPDPR